MYHKLETDIFSIFKSNEWKAESLEIVPANFAAKGSKEYIRVNIIPSGIGINKESISGILLIDIFIAAGNGSKRTFEIADKLDLYLAYKSLSSEAGIVTQFLGSSLSPSGLDKDNKLLYRSLYTIPFNYFGVT